MDVAAKTGTTDDNYDRWLCGFTEYYTAVAWYGYDYNEKINYSGAQNPASVIWSSVMQSVHSGLTSRYFEKPNDVTCIKICKSTGLEANPSCGDTYDEYFLRGTIPKKCTQHNSKNKGSSTTEVTTNTNTNTDTNTNTNTNTNTKQNENVDTNNSVTNEVQNVTNTLNNNSINNNSINNTNTNNHITNTTNNNSANNNTNTTSSSGNSVSGNNTNTNTTKPSTNSTTGNTTANSVNNMLENSTIND